MNLGLVGMRNIGDLTREVLRREDVTYNVQAL